MWMIVPSSQSAIYCQSFTVDVCIASVSVSDLNMAVALTLARFQMDESTAEAHASANRLLSVLDKRAYLMRYSK